MYNTGDASFVLAFSLWRASLSLVALSRPDETSGADQMVFI